MKIAVIGATGMAGRAIVKEALSRGHEVTGFVRNPEKAAEIFDQPVDVRKQDAFGLTRPDLLPFDAVIDAFRPAPDQAYLQIDLAARLVHALRETESPRLVVLVGAASLHFPDGSQLYDQLIQVPGHERWIAIPESQAHELEFLSHVTNVNWLAFSPSETLQPGPATGYVGGTDQLLFDEDGQSILNSGNLALALLDELEKPQHHQTRMTARNG